MLLLELYATPLQDAGHVSTLFKRRQTELHTTSLDMELVDLTNGMEFASLMTCPSGKRYLNASKLSL